LADTVVDVLAIPGDVDAVAPADGGGPACGVGTDAPMNGTAPPTSEARN
jgi:hypothetical protein